MLNKFINLNTSNKILTLKILFLLNITHIILRVVKLKYFVKNLSKTIIIPNNDLKQGYKICYFINRISNYTLAQNNCLTNAIVAKLLFRKFNLPNTLYVGVKKHNNKLQAHAYLSNIQNEIVIGNSTDSFNVILRLADHGA